MVIVTVPPAAMAPFQVTVLVATVATATPVVASALTSVSSGGSTSLSSSPGLSVRARPPLCRVTV
jgi:hypothetical protein